MIFAKGLVVDSLKTSRDLVYSYRLSVILIMFLSCLVIFLIVCSHYCLYLICRGSDLIKGWTTTSPTWARFTIISYNLSRKHQPPPSKWIFFSFQNCVRYFIKISSGFHHFGFHNYFLIWS